MIGFDRSSSTAAPIGLRVLHLTMLIGCTLASAAARAADTSPPPAGSDQSDSLQEVVVVTGTLIRNTAPVGSTLIDLDQTRISTVRS